MIAAEIAGYEYKTAKRCAYCIEPIAKQLLIDNDCATVYGDYGDAEEFLGELELLLGEDRDYWSPDDYPVPFSHEQASMAASHAAYDGDNAPKCAKCNRDFLEY